MSVIKLQDVSKVYSYKGFNVQALNNLNVEVNHGEMLAIMGTSGSGKSTLLNILGCIDKVSSGKYYLENEDILMKNFLQLAELRNKKFGFVLQEFALVERYTVRQNVMLPLHYTKLKRNMKEDMVKDILEKVGLINKLNILPTMLSGGQRQRVAIARALVNNADIILCDEPTGALDSFTSKEIMKLLKSINELGNTVLIVTHDQNIAKYCNRIITISDGKIVEDKDIKFKSTE